MKKNFLAKRLGIGCATVAMLACSLTAFAAPEDRPIKGVENLMAANGIIVERSEENGEVTYEILKGTKAQLDKAIEDNNAKIADLLEKNPLASLEKEHEFTANHVGWWNADKLRIDNSLDITKEEFKDYVSAKNADVLKAEKSPHEHDWMYYYITTSDNKVMRYKACSICEKWSTVSAEDFPSKAE